MFIVARSDPDLGWVEVESTSYGEAWASIVSFRRGHARRLLSGWGAWTLVGVVAALGVWVDASPRWLDEVLWRGPLIVGCVLWFTRIPFRQPYVGLFAAIGLWSLSLVISQAVGPSDWGLAIGVSVFVVCAAGFVGSEGLRIPGIAVAHLDPNPEHAASRVVRWEQGV